MSEPLTSINCGLRGTTTIYSPTPVKPVISSHRPGLLNAVSFQELPRVDSLMRPQRPYKSLVERLDPLDLSNMNSESLENSLEEKIEIERFTSPDFLEGMGDLGEVQPPVRAQNPQIRDKEFLKMNKNKIERVRRFSKEMREMFFSSEC